MTEILQVVLECPLGRYIVTASTAIDVSTKMGEDIYRLYREMPDGSLVRLT